MNAELNGSADAHSGWMLSTDTFSHTGIGGSDPGTRMRDAGYVFSGSWSWGENIAWSGTTGTLNPNAAAVQHHQNLFLSAGHRTNILNGLFPRGGCRQPRWQVHVGQQHLQRTDDHRELCHVRAPSASSPVLPTTIRTTMISTRSAKPAAVSRSTSWRTAPSRRRRCRERRAAMRRPSRAAPRRPVDVDVRFTGGGLAAPMGVAVTLEGSNVKLDLVDGDTILSNVTATLIYRSAAACNSSASRMYPAPATARQRARRQFRRQPACGPCRERHASRAAAATTRCWAAAAMTGSEGGLGSDRLAGNAGNDIFVSLHR